MSVSPDGHTVLTVESGGLSHLWNTSTGTKRFSLRHGCGAREAQFIAGGTLAVTWSRDAGDCESKVMVWEVATGAAKATVSTEAASIGFSRNAKSLFTTTNSSRLTEQPVVRVWDVDTGDERFTDPIASNGNVRTAALSPDGTRLVVVSGPRVAMWAVGGGMLQSVLAAATTVCLSAEFRQQNLGESAAVAMQAFEACERKHGRK